MCPDPTGPHVLSRSYGILEAHDWFLSLMRSHEEFEVETDRAGEPPLSFWSKTVRGVMVEQGQKPPNAARTLGAGYVSER